MTRARRRLSLLAATLLAVGLSFGSNASAVAQEIDVVVDQATVLKLPEQVGTIVVGNPLIADVSVQAGGMLVVTGKGYGSTNVVVLDRTGQVLLDRSVRVHGPQGNVVVVYRGIQRETYSCQPKCERRITLGDGTEYFNSTMIQTTTRNAQAQGPGAQTR